MLASRLFSQVATRALPTTRNLRFFHASPQALAKLNVEGLAEKVNLEGQNVLVRVDLNVPLDKVRDYIVLVNKKKYINGKRLIGFCLYFIYNNPYYHTNHDIIHRKM